MPDEDFIQLNQLSKRFGGVTALHGVSFGIRSGEVHAIVGENGAGKSTLMKLLAGVHQPDSGEIQIEGQTVRLQNPREAQRQGISIVFQELNLFPHRSVAANVFANRELTGRSGMVNRQAMLQETERVLQRMSVSISPDAPLGTLSIGEKQLVEIARSLQQESRIIILDEPNSALNEVESKRLFEIVRGLRARGITVIYVSHRLEEVFAIADRITVIRDGHFQGTFVTAETTISQIITTMIGRPLTDLFPQRPSRTQTGDNLLLRDEVRSGTSNAMSDHSCPRPPGSVVLQVRELSAKARLGPISFAAYTGEILGFAGLEGAGVDELFGVLFGLAPMTGGQIVVRDKKQEPSTPRDAMRGGWALIPASRRDQGLLMNWSIARNTTLLVLDQLLSRLGLIARRTVSAATDRYIGELGIVCHSQNQAVANLSGGNQQKVLLAKWLATAPTILLLNNPTRGVDVGAKWEIYELCQKLTGQGMTILMTSGEIEEVVGLSDRVLVLSKGKLVREFHRGQVTKAEILHAMAGQVN